MLQPSIANTYLAFIYMSSKDILMDTLIFLSSPQAESGTPFCVIPYYTITSGHLPQRITLRLFCNCSLT